ncbi:MAG: LysM peptidoglycan-binding domain-containing protein [Candidatus Saccharimonadales bacterium]
MRGVLERRFIFILVLCITMFVQGVSVNAVEYGGLGGVPANPDPENSRSKSIFIYSLAPNQAKQDGVRVVNNSSETKRIEIYPTDSEIASGGSFACKQKDDDKKDVGDWINISKTELTLAAYTEEVIPFSINTPANTGVGEHNGCLVIQEKDKDSAQSGNGVQLSFRSAIRVAVTIPGEIKKDIEFSNILIKKDPGKYTLTAQLYNKGNVSLDTDIKLSVKDGLNRNVYNNGGVYPLLAQTQPVELNFEFPRPFWGGWYKITGTADYNNDTSVQLGKDSTNNVRRSAPSKMLFVSPQPVAAAIEILLLLLLLVLVILITRRLQKRKRISRTWKPYTIKSGDTLVALAKTRGTSWRTLAKANKLRAPYDLKPGKTIRLPVK